MASGINYWSMARFAEEVGGGAIKGAVAGATVGISIAAYLQSKLEVPGPLPHTYSTDVAYTQAGRVASVGAITICLSLGLWGGIAYGTIHFCFKKQPEQQLPR